MSIYIVEIVPFLFVFLRKFFFYCSLLDHIRLLKTLYSLLERNPKLLTYISENRTTIDMESSYSSIVL